MPMDNRIDYVEFGSKDFDVDQAFYEAVFGWKFIDWGADYRSFSDGSIEGGFYRSTKVSDTTNGSALVIVYAKNLEETRDRVVASGGRIKTDVFLFPGGRRFQFNDPSGNELGVWSDTSPED